MISSLKYTMFLIVTSIVFANAANATPANAIYAKYDLKRQELLVKVEHQSSKYTKHFIDRVDVSKNGALVATKTFTLQSSHRNQTMPPIKFSARAGDVISITATCNKGGTKKTELTVK